MYFYDIHRKGMISQIYIINKNVYVNLLMQAKITKSEGILWHSVDIPLRLVYMAILYCLNHNDTNSPCEMNI